MGRRSDIDWPAIERVYRIGQLSDRELARTYEINVSSISRRAAKHKWTRDLSAEVRVRTRAALIADPTPGTANATAKQQESNSASRAKDEDGVASAVRTNVEVVRQHRVLLARGNTVAHKLLNRLEEVTDKHDQVVEEIAGSDEAPTTKRLMQKAVDLPSLAQAAQALSATLRNLIPLERRAFNLDEPDEGATNGERVRIVKVPLKDSDGTPVVRPIGREDG